MKMKEIFNKNKFDLIKYSPMKPGTKSIMSEERKKSSQGGVYGAFKKEEDTPPDYVGNSKNMYQRCIVNHQKPSADLARKMVRDETGMSEWDYVKKHGRLEGQRIYFEKAKEILSQYEFRVLEYCNCPEDRRIKEGALIRYISPKYNWQNY